MKIAYLCSSQSLGGLELNHLKNAQWMHLRGHDVTVLAVLDSPLYLKAKAWGLKAHAIQRHRKYYDFKAAWTLSRWLKKNQIEALFTRDTRDLSMSASLKFILGSKFCTAYFMEMQMGVNKTNLLHTLRYRFLDHWFCPLPYLQKQVSEWTKTATQKIHLLPSALDLSTCEPMDKTKARISLGLQTSKTIFGLIGRFDHQKGQLLLLEATTLAKNKDFILVFLGEPTKNESNGVYEAMLDFIQSHGLLDRVSFLPFSDDISPFYSSLDALIMATKAETFGMVTLEALAHQVPVIGSQAGGTLDLVRGGEFGLLFEPMSASSLAEKMDGFMDGTFSMDRSELKAHLAQFDHHHICASIENLLLLPKC